MIALDLIHSHDPMFPWEAFHTLWRSPEIFDAQVEDGYPPPDQIEFLSEAKEDTNIWLVYDGDQFWGFTVLEQRALYWSEIHVSFLRKAPGMVKKGALLWTLQAAFNAFNQHKVSAFIAAYNRPARFLAREVGMTPEGRVSKSFLRNGRLHDRIVYGVTKDEFSLRFGAKCQ